MCASSLSSVAVVGQGRPSLGDAHYEFFCRIKNSKTRKLKTMEKIKGLYKQQRYNMAAAHWCRHNF